MTKLMKMATIWKVELCNIKFMKTEAKKNTNIHMRIRNRNQNSCDA